MNEPDFRCPDSRCRAPIRNGVVPHVRLCGFRDMSANDVRRYHGAEPLPELDPGVIHVDGITKGVDLTVGDRRSLHAFAAFLRYAGPVGDRKVKLHPEWLAWMKGEGPTPDPDSEVGPEPYVAPAPDDPFAGCRDRCQQVGMGRCNCA